MRKSVAILMAGGVLVGCGGSAPSAQPPQQDGFALHLAPSVATQPEKPTAATPAPAATTTAEKAPSAPAPVVTNSATSAAKPPEKPKTPSGKPTDLQFDKDLSAADWDALKLPAGSGSLAKVDLNLDGKPDYILVDRRETACGSAGCATQVFVSSGDRWLKGLDVTTRYISVAEVVTNGAHEIVTEDVTRWVWKEKSYELGERWQAGCVKQAELKAAKPPAARRADKTEVSRRFGKSFDEFAEKQPKIYDEIMAEDGVSSFMMFGGVLELVRLGNGAEVLLLGGQGPHVEGYKRRTVAYDVKQHQALLLIDTGSCNQKQFGRGTPDVQALLYAFTARYDNL